MDNSVLINMAFNNCARFIEIEENYKLTVYLSLSYSLILSFDLPLHYTY